MKCCVPDSTGGSLNLFKNMQVKGKHCEQGNLWCLVWTLQNTETLFSFGLNGKMENLKKHRFFYFILIFGVWWFFGLLIGGWRSSLTTPNLFINASVSFVSTGYWCILFCLLNMNKNTNVQEDGNYVTARDCVSSCFYDYMSLKIAFVISQHTVSEIKHVMLRLNPALLPKILTLQYIDKKINLHLCLIGPRPALCPKMRSRYRSVCQPASPAPLTFGCLQRSNMKLFSIYNRSSLEILILSKVRYYYTLLLPVVLVWFFVCLEPSWWPPLV